jgi:hypothetical protein
MNENEKQFHLPDSGFNAALEDTAKTPKTREAKNLTTFAESMELANDLLNRHGDEIRSQMGKDIDGWGEPYTDWQKSISHFITGTSEDILKRFVGHGITRKDGVNQLAAALNILANKSIKGECGRLGGSGGYHAYNSGDFIVISKLDFNLPVTVETNGEQETKFNEIGWLANIGAFVVDTKYYSIVEELKKMFPEVNIIRANELPKYLKV